MAIQGLKARDRDKFNRTGPNKIRALLPTEAEATFQQFQTARLEAVPLQDYVGEWSDCCAREKLDMPIVDISSLREIERLPGWHGRYFHSANMTFAHYSFVSGASIHEHFHPQEEVYEVIEGELELTIDGVAQIVRPGLVAIVPSGVRHSVNAVTDGRAIIVDHPIRPEFG